MYEPVKIDRHGEMYPGAPVYGVYDEDGEWGAKCSFGQPGDTLWVREKWAPVNDCDPDHSDGAIFPDSQPPYRPEMVDRWRSPIHMPRWASRITLQITDVRVERLQDVSRADAIAEGCPFEKPDGRAANTDPKLWFMRSWDTINAKRGYPWESNPFVWVLEFSRDAA
jgi:hypothetical protein